jgi:hypothetical protein
MRVRTFVVAGSVLALLAVTAGCSGSSGSSVAGAGTSPAPTTASAPTAASTGTSTTTRGADNGSQPTPTGRAAGGGSAGVPAASFRVDLTVQRAGLALLALTNTTKHVVTLRGWPTLLFLNAANETVPVPVRQVAVPGAGPVIPIGPGETAFAGVQWTVGDKSDPKTFVVTGLRLIPPGGTGSVGVAVVGEDGLPGGYTEFDLTSAKVGTLQPSSQGVLVF